ncbi:hypothetical protein Pmar_PMAR012018 [Perkinsus marinus ATCC 50983]|uniref:Uncharacterized protein n=1 Tax=Perkinsus marinus (strain ATCC 50983 / TXsc) TaxID=423536 RepID=C5LW73_PERM5|nr:hypothetical protein Pmar_PMAR012018 [Perkinsus marinus ATCC 50983]EEQ99010.1 hypothetical protein Pmar_PMAR012018 [Perkinsus marinus ATCC 50983]|eukprot:XP_002766293.1 hypothetical protein Pmar_PMAR012018 [Perkinsus marinus ATCC 50983]
MIQHFTLLITVVPALRGQLSDSNFTPEVHCGRVQEGSLFVAASNGGQPGEVADIMCAVLTDEKKPDYLVVSRIGEDAGGVVVNRNTSSCTIRPVKDGTFTARSTACDPMRESKVFNFTYIPTFFPSSTVQWSEYDDEQISLSRPAPIEVVDAAVFVGDDDEFRVAKVTPEGPWYLQRGDAFFPIPMECVEKKKKRGFFKKLSGSRPVNTDSVTCDSGAGQCVTMSLDGDLHHLLLGSVSGFKLAGVPFVLVAKGHQEWSLTFTVLRPIMRKKLKSALKPFEDFHSEQIKQKK